jgi:hypothetical protein
MKIRYLLLYLILYSLSLYAQQAKTKLVINTSFEGSYILIDGRFESRGKLEIDLPAGTYNVCVKESLIKWTGAEVTDEIIVSGTESKIEKYYSLGKHVLLNSEPQNAGVLSRDSLIGYTPLFVNQDVKNLTLLKNNYGAQNINLNPAVINEVDLGKPVNENSKSFVRSVWFKVLIGSAAVLGAVAAYYKVQADRKYDDYLADSSSGVMSEVKRYDNISGAALGALQINFGVLLYFLLTE